MKIFSTDKIREADAFTIKNEPISSINLMERASTKLFEWIKKHVQADRTIIIFVGLGNNGGDGAALARMLSQNGYKVIINIIRYSDNASSDFLKNYQRLQNTKSLEINEVTNINDIAKIENNDVIIDAIFGSGLTRPITGFVAKIINFINLSNAITISIDIPSGLFADKTSILKNAEIIKADYTLSFQFPKLAFLFPENEMYVGNWQLLDIGLSSSFINSTPSPNNFINNDDAASLIKVRTKFSHKGNFGHALLIAGSYGKMGAAILAAKACLRAGVGLLHTHLPKSGVQIMQTSVPESMVSIDDCDNYFTKITNATVFNTIGIGPGLGVEKQTQLAFKNLIQNTANPMVIDADALNILAINRTWLAFLPQGSIITPHPKEFFRLTGGGYNNDFERLEKQRQIARKHQIYIVLKGAHTSICSPNGDCFFNSTGNPGMATAGSGDVLTGVITGLLSSGYSPAAAAVLGVYLHGLAGDFAEKATGYESLIASDIIDKLGNAFKSFSD